MLVHKLTLPDGSVLDAGVIRSVTLTEQVNDQTDLCPGAACAACAEIELWAPRNGLQIAQGEELILTRVDTGSGRETQAGIFLAEKPVKVSANVIRVTAYDRMTLLDKTLSPWLREQQEAFPMTLADFIRAVCAQCGVALAEGTLNDLPNAGYEVQAFYADDLTGRQLIQWAAQAACRFARMTRLGMLEFGWYRGSAAAGVGPAENPDARVGLRLAGVALRTAGGEVWRFGMRQAGYLSGTLTYEEYTTAPIDKVQIRQSDDDVGGIYPAEEQGTNALVLQGNLLLTTESAEALRPVAQAIYEQIADIRYTPLSVAVQAGEALPRPGDIVTVTDAYGRTMQTCIMERTLSGQRCTLESTGNARRDSTAAVNRQSYTNLRGKMLEIAADVDGLKITASELSGGMASLELTVDGLRTEVSGKLDGDEASTMIEQSLQGLTLSAEAGDQSSTLTLKAGGVTLSSAEITFRGMVTFEDLASAGGTTINGGNITTGKIGSEAGNTVYDLDAGTLRTGRSGGSRVEMDDRGIKWYVENGGKSYLTGVLYSKYGATYIGDNSRYTFLGWFSSGTPDFGWSSGGAHSNFVGIAIDQTGATIHCNASKFEIPGRIECTTLAVNGREI